MPNTVVRSDVSCFLWQSKYLSAHLRSLHSSVRPLTFVLLTCLCPLLSTSEADPESTCGDLDAIEVRIVLYIQSRGMGVKPLDRSSAQEHLTRASHCGHFALALRDCSRHAQISDNG